MPGGLAKAAMPACPEGHESDPMFPGTVCRPPLCLQTSTLAWERGWLPGHPGWVRQQDSGAPSLAARLRGRVLQLPGGREGPGQCPPDLQALPRRVLAGRNAGGCQCPTACHWRLVASCQQPFHPGQPGPRELWACPAPPHGPPFLPWTDG